MKKLLTLSRTLAVPLAMGCCTSVIAQSLGTPAADLWVGQPLQMTVPARFVEGEGGGECVHADVFYGASRLQASRVTATVIGPEDARRVRIEAAVPIDEPVVTVSLRAGCRNSITRSYTLLPDIASESVLAALARPQPPLVTAPTPLATVTAAAPNRAPRLRPVRAEAAVLKAAPALAQATETAPARTRGGMHLAAWRRAPAARLRLEPIDTNPQAFLRVTAALAQPTGDASRRATAALLWQAINADPQDLLRTSAMLQKLEGELQQLRQTAGATRSEMAVLRQRIDGRQPWYAATATIQVLALMVLAAAAAAGMLWWRTRKLVLAPPPWWERAPSEPTLAPRAAVGTAPAMPAAAPAQRSAAPLPAAVRTTPQPVPAATLAGAVSAAATAVARAPASIGFTLPEQAPPRAASGVLRVETLAATFEESEFLSSLGLNADAMDVLRTYLQDSGKPAPIAYYELMRLCDQAEDPQALETVRRRYGKVFGTPAPTLAQVTAGTGIDAVPALRARITATWGTTEALDVIEQTLFASPAGEALLTLQAGRELLTLHDLAMALASEAPAAAHGASLAAESHPMAPWAHAEDPAMASAMAQAFADADGGHRFALDVDLDAPPAPPAPMPEASDDTPLDIDPELQNDPELAPLLDELQATAQRQAAARAQTEAEDAFSAAVALERAPTSRY